MKNEPRSWTNQELAQAFNENWDRGLQKSRIAETFGENYDLSATSKNLLTHSMKIEILDSKNQELAETFNENWDLEGKKQELA